MSDEIENLLRKMRLRRPSASLDDRVLSGRRGSRAARWAVGALAAAAAVAVIAVLLWRPARPGSRPQTPAPRQAAAAAPQPVRMEEGFSQVRYEGLLLLDERTPVRKFRWQRFRRVTWIDREAGFTAEMTVPDEEVILVVAPTY